MQSLSTTWALCFITVKVLRRTEPRLCDCTALQQHRGMHTRHKHCSDWALDAHAAKRQDTIAVCFFIHEAATAVK
jgi:hypothetical protein